MEGAHRRHEQVDQYVGCIGGRRLDKLEPFEHNLVPLPNMIVIVASSLQRVGDLGPRLTGRQIRGSWLIRELECSR
jgi:hypothetical protein